LGSKGLSFGGSARPLFSVASVKTNHFISQIDL
jgi:hypothetical protein